MADGGVVLHAQPHPLRGELLHCTAPAGMTLAEMLGPDCGGAIRAWVGDVEIPRAAWARVRPKAGAVVTARAVAQDPPGGGDSNKVLRTVLTIAVLAAASYLPGAAAGASVLAKVAYAGAIIGGTLAVNALVPPQLPRPGGPAIGLNALSGTQNQVMPFGPVPRVYGKPRVYPPYAAKPYTEVVGNEQYLRALFCLGYGPLEVSDLKIGETPISAAGVLPQGVVTEGSGFANLTFEISSAPTLFSSAVNEEPLSIAMDHDGDQQQRSTVAGAREISVDLIFPAGIIDLHSDGDKSTVRIGFLVEYRLAGSGGAWLNAKDAAGFQLSSAVTEYVEGANIYFQDRTSHARRGSVRWTVSDGQYEVRLTRVDTERLTIGGWVDDDNVDGGLVFWSALRSVGTAAATPRADYVYLALRVRASKQLNGVLDTVNCMAQSVLDVWDGAAFVQQATSNPAWIYLDAAAGAATERKVDKATRFYLDELKDWADDCAAAGREFNAEVSSVYGRTTVFDLMREIAAAGRASFSMRNGKYTVVRDLPGQVPVQLFTPRNSWGFSAERTFQQLPHAFLVRFLNGEAGFKADEMVVYDDGYSAANATRREALELRGITKPAQVWEEARYHLAVARQRPRRYTLNCDFENLVCQRGDLVRVAHDVIAVGLAAGRIKSVAGAVLTLDETVTMESGKIYALRIRKTVDGSVVLKTLITAAGEQTTVTMTATESGLAEGDLFTFGEAGQESLAAKVLKVMPGPDLSAELTLVPEAPGVHDADAGEMPGHQGPASANPLAPEAPRVYHQQSDESVLLPASDGSLTSRIVLHYGFRSSTRPPAVTVEAEYRLTGQEFWTAVPPLPADAGEVSFLPVDDGVDYDLRLRALAADGTPSEWTTLSAYRVIGKTTPPADIEALFLAGDMLTWEYPSPPRDLRGFLVRYHAGRNTVWENAIAAHGGVLAGPPFNVGDMPGGTRTILVKAVDTSGIESAAPAILVTDLGDPLTRNIAFETDYGDSGYPGTITNGAVVGSELHADAATDLWSGNDNNPLWSGDDTALLWTASYKELVYEASFAPAQEWTGLGSTLILEPRIVGDSWKLEYRTQGTAPLWSGDDSQPLWSGNDANPLWSGDEPWRPWPGQVADILRETYEFRLTVVAGAVQGKALDFPIIVDVPDIEEVLEDVAIAAAGTRLPVTKTYRRIVNVGYTLQDDGGDAVTLKIEDKNISGPLTFAYTAAGAATTASIDARIKGY